VNGSLVGGSAASVTVTGSSWKKYNYVFNGSGFGSTTIPSLGIDLEIANATIVARGKANAFGEVTFTKPLKAAWSGMTVYLQAADDDGKISSVVVDAIL
jgi:hypothetical protein